MAVGVTEVAAPSLRIETEESVGSILAVGVTEVSTGIGLGCGEGVDIGATVGQGVGVSVQAGAVVTGSEGSFSSVEIGVSAGRVLFGLVWQLAKDAIKHRKKKLRITELQVSHWL